MWWVEKRNAKKGFDNCSEEIKGQKGQVNQRGMRRGSGRAPGLKTSNL